MASYREFPRGMSITDIFRSMGVRVNDRTRPSSLFDDVGSSARAAVSQSKVSTPVDRFPIGTRVKIGELTATVVERTAISAGWQAPEYREVRFDDSGFVGVAKLDEMKVIGASKVDPIMVGLINPCARFTPRPMPSILDSMLAEMIRSEQRRTEAMLIDSLMQTSSAFGMSAHDAFACMSPLMAAKGQLEVAALKSELRIARRALEEAATDAIMFAWDLSKTEEIVNGRGVKCDGSVVDGVRSLIAKLDSQIRDGEVTAGKLRTLEAKVKTLENFVDRSDLRRNGEHVVDAALRLLCMARDKSSVFDYERTIKTYQDSAKTSEKYVSQLKEDLVRETSSRDGTIAALRVKLESAEMAVSKRKAAEKHAASVPPGFVSCGTHDAAMKRSSDSLNAEIQARRDVTRERDKLATDFKTYKATAEKTSSDCEKTINDLRRQVRLLGLSKRIKITMRDQGIRFDGWRLPATDDLFLPLMQQCIGLRTDEAMDKAKHGVLEILRSLHRDLVVKVDVERDIYRRSEDVVTTIDMDLVNGLLAGSRC